VIQVKWKCCKHLAEHLARYWYFYNKCLSGACDGGTES